MAQALVHNPEVLVLDEPTIGLDPKQIIEIRQLIKSLGGSHTVILSTHILPEVSMTCDRIVIINHGRVAGEGTPEGLVAQLKDGDSLRATVAGPRDQALQVLRQVDGVLQVQAEPGTEGVYRVAVTPGREVRDELARQVVGAGLALRELRPLDMSLEDIFLRLTTEEVNAHHA
jgi:ABC-2 type transport system ATP-binding protein